MKKTALFACFVFTLFMMATLSAQAASTARITRLEGSASINGRPASAGSHVKDGDWVATGRKSSCEIVFGDRNVIRLSEKTFMKISLSGEEKVLDIVRGAFSALARGLGRLGNKRQFALTVNTPTAVCGVRGTAFYVQVEDSVSSYVCLCNGRMQVAGKDGGETRQAEASHHKAFRLTAHPDSVSIADAPMIHHTDQDMESLAGEISEKMDWTKVE